MSDTTTATNAAGSTGTATGSGSTTTTGTPPPPPSGGTETKVGDVKPPEGQTGETKPPEGTKPPEPKPDPAKESRISAKLNEIRTRETQLAEREAKLKQSESTTQAEVTKLRDQLAAFEAAKGDPVALLKLLGYDGDDAVDRFTKDLTADPESRKVGRKVSELEKRLAEKELKEKEAAEAKLYQEHFAKAQANITAAFEKLGEDAEIARSYGPEAVSSVIEVADAYFKKWQKPLPLEQAVKVVAKAYEDNWVKAASGPRAKKLYQPPAPKKDDPPPPPAKETKTLSNTTGTESPPPPAPRKRLFGRQSERAELAEQINSHFATRGTK